MSTGSGASGSQRAKHEARLARQELGVGLEAPLPDMLELLEQASIAGAKLRVSVLPLPEGVAGAYLRREGRPFFFVNSSDWPVRRRFTLAHEFGHLRLGHEPMIDTDRDLQDFATQREVEANSFAAEFLAPEAGVRAFAAARQIDDWDIDHLVQLAAYFKISNESARYRLEDAGLLATQEKRILDAAIAAGEHKLAARRAGLIDPPGEGGLDGLGRVGLGEARVAEVALRQGLRAYEHRLLDSSRLGELLGVDKDFFERVAQDRGVEPAEDAEPEPVPVSDEDW